MLLCFLRCSVTQECHRTRAFVGNSGQLGGTIHCQPNLGKAQVKWDSLSKPLCSLGSVLTIVAVLPFRRIQPAQTCWKSERSSPSPSCLHGCEMVAKILAWCWSVLSPSQVAAETQLTPETGKYSVGYLCFSSQQSPKKSLQCQCFLWYTDFGWWLLRSANVCSLTSFR